MASISMSQSAALALATASNAPGAKAASDPKVKARAQAVDFEGMFLNSMFSQMFTGIDGDGPFGGNGGAGVWRSFLTEQYAKSFAKAGGIGIADQVYRSLISQQEVSAAPRA
jgi:Rod binding domain-containing protein